MRLTRVLAFTIVVGGAVAQTQQPRLVEDIVPGTGSSFPTEFVDVDGKLYFAAVGSSGFKELWSTDGTQQGTVQLTTLGGTVEGCFRVQDRLFFSSILDGLVVLYVLDSGTITKVRSFQSLGGILGLIPLAAIDDNLIFQAKESSTGRELWVSDGTAAGTSVIDINVGPGDSDPGKRSSLLVDELFYFSATDGTSIGIYVTDGTPAGTERVFWYEWRGYQYVQLGDELFFGGRISSVSQALSLWKTDGTAQGTVAVEAITTFSSVLTSMVRAGGWLYYSDNIDVWRTDGAIGAATRVPRSVGNAIHNISSFPSLFAVGDSVLFEVATANPLYPVFGNPVDYWVNWSDGTSTTRLVSISGGIRDAVAVGNRFAFFVDDSGQLGVTDGTNSGTRTLQGWSTTLATQFTLSGGKLYYSGNDGASGEELFVVDLDAHVQTLGHGCSADGFPPQLGSTDPAIGQTLRFDLRGAEPGLSGGLWFGLPNGQTAVGLGRNCDFYFPLAVVLEVGPLVPDAAGEASLSLPLANSSALIGARVNAQAIQWYSNNSMGLDFSNGLGLTLGI